MNKIKFDIKFSSEAEIVTLPPGSYFIGFLDHVFKDETVEEILQYIQPQNENKLPSNKFGLKCISSLSGYLLFFGQCNGDIVIDEIGFEYPKKNFPFFGCVPIELFKIDNIISLENAKEVGKIIKSSTSFVCKYESGNFEINRLKISSNITNCNMCKNIFHINDMTEVGNNWYCDNCYDELPRCDNCKEVVEYADDLTLVGDNWYCDDCYDELPYCHYCGQVFENDNDLTLVGDNWYCDDCYKELPSCDNCGEVVEGKNDLIEVSGKFYCEECYYEVPHCYNCKEVFEDDADLTLVGNHLYCDDCYKELPSCDNCGEVFEYEDDLIEYDENLYCKDCYGKILKDNKEEENEDE